jgi:peptide/nickel transport system substrate-binding protein
LFSLDHAWVYSETSTLQYALEDSPLTDYTIQSQKAGWGPFVLDDWAPEQWVILDRNEDYPQNPLGGTAGPSKSLHIEKIVATTYSDSAALRIAIEKGEIDATIGGGITQADVPDLQANPNIEVNLIPFMGSGAQLHLNYGPEFYPLNVTEVRKAFNYLIDPDEIIDKLMFGTAVRMDSPVRPMQPYYKGIYTDLRDNVPMEDRIQMAKDLLTDAGFPEGFTCVLWYSPTSTTTKAIGEILKDQLAKGGINLELKTMESGVLGPMTRAGEIPIFLRGWTHDYPDPDSELFYLMHSTSPDLTKRIKFNNSHIDALIQEGRNLYNPDGDPPRRAEVYEEIQDWYFDNAYATPLYFSSMWDVQRTWVENYPQWVTCDKPWEGLWNIQKEIPSDWADYDPPA